MEHSSSRLASAQHELREPGNVFYRVVFAGCMTEVV